MIKFSDYPRAYLVMIVCRLPLSILKGIGKGCFALCNEIAKEIIEWEDWLRSAIIYERVQRRLKKAIKEHQKFEQEKYRIRHENNESWRNE